MATGFLKDTVDLEVLVDLEQQFYDAGYKDGLDHGEVHGRIEGRQLGREKGFEMWEELGFYEGFAKIWKAASEQETGNNNRISHNAKLLLDLIGQFPMKNPLHTDSADIDITKLFGQIRARYKLLCATVGVKPSLRASQAQTVDDSGLTDETTASIASSKNNKARTVDSVKSTTVDLSF